jgi:hypothetical protein
MISLKYEERMRLRMISVRGFSMNVIRMKFSRNAIPMSI